MANGLMFGASYTWSRYMAYGTPSAYVPLRAVDVRAQRRRPPPGIDHQLCLRRAETQHALRRQGARRSDCRRVDIGRNQLLHGRALQAEPGHHGGRGTDFTGSSDGARINVVGDPYLPKDQRTFGRNFDTTAGFAAPPACSWTNQTLACFGNAGTNIMYGPGTNNWDLSVSER